MCSKAGEILRVVATRWALSVHCKQFSISGRPTKVVWGFLQLGGRPRWITHGKAIRVYKCLGRRGVIGLELGIDCTVTEKEDRIALVIGCKQRARELRCEGPL